jgi:hypothetical protein
MPTFAAVTLLFTGFAAAECLSSDAEQSAGNRYTVDGAVVSDNATGLVWAHCSVGQSWQDETTECMGNPLKATYDDATKATYPAGWRLPKPDELTTIVVENCQNPSVDSEVFPGTAPDPYWAVDEEGCWIVNFGPGTTYGPNSYLCGYGSVGAVRLIRD